MKIFYSAKINGFIVDFTIPAFKQNDTLPDDLVEITEDVHAEFLAGKPGYRMTPGINGKPEWIND
ncbi:hypothetical protein MUU47_07685 [Scandinavium sp. H11S7]|uniref:Uncharacterized protein n=1 Tax=Scandinavium hiltneri TaxID=2926519 RepID=A0ABT2DZH6_9ENTR|nr:hypothetical protein [Scandinavium hiltneri]MCS2161009.1 hypothetical protein [Scandinavium hiltneri]